MNVFEMVVIIVIIGCVTGVANNYFRAKRHAGPASEDLDEALDRIDDLEERVRVLEKVVTDDKYDLGRQIDSLRDQ